jgi:hypothetical protein
MNIQSNLHDELYNNLRLYYSYQYQKFYPDSDQCSTLNINDIINSVRTTINEFIRNFTEQKYFKRNQLSYSVIQDCCEALLVSVYTYNGEFGCCFTNHSEQCVQIQFTSKSHCQSMSFAVIRVSMIRASS